MMRRSVRVLLRISFWGCVLGLLVWYLLPKPTLLEQVAFSKSIVDRNGKLLRITLTPDEKYRMFTPLNQISPALVDATVAYEDRHFYKHPGVNPVALARAGWQWMRTRNMRAGGASTITMQVARLRFGLHTRSLGGKLQQICRALQLERHYSKAKILEAYLNLAPYGGNIEGAGAAGVYYFGKQASLLTAPEAVALCVLPQRPSRSIGPGKSAAQERAATRLGGQYSGIKDAAGFSITRPAGFPFLAPHFTWRVAGLAESRQPLCTTLDLRKQIAVEKEIQNFVAQRQRDGINNVSALLVNYRTMEVIAHAGSADYWNDEILGQIDGTRAPRSPGSALKPFIYALAMEQGLFQPASLLKDAPRRFSEYDPDNCDKEFAGPLSATEALVRSRNLPALELDAKLRSPGFYGFLCKAGISLPQSAREYGLTLTLGGAEVTMEQMVSLYAMLANNGVQRPLRRVSKSIMPAGQRLLSSEAAFLTLNMLCDVGKFDALAESLPEAGWKTGTSNGYRDAWCVGIFDSYVLAVWVGNFDGHPCASFVGRDAAAPLFVRIAARIRALNGNRTEPRPGPDGLNLKQVELCALSGALPNACCPHRKEGWFIPGVSPIEECQIHREVLLDAATGLRVLSERDGQNVYREVYELWPSDVLALLERAGVPRRVPPAYAAGQTPDQLARGGNAPRITSPAAGLEYRIRSQQAEGSFLWLSAEADGDVGTLYWFAGKTFIGSAKPKEPILWRPSAPVDSLIVVDDHGRTSSCKLAFAWAE